MISIHAPTKGVTDVLNKKSKEGIISIHAPTKGVTREPTTEALRMCNFNPRSHEGSDTINGGLGTAKIISIHAPTKGVT